MEPEEAPAQHSNIDPSGDECVPREVGDGLVRVAYQNVRGLSSWGLETSEEVQTMADYGMDCMGLSETKRPWTPQNKWEYNWMMKSRFGQHWTEFSSATSQYDQKYQPGGNALTILGNLVGRRSGSGADEQGRFCWYTLRGQRDEGVCIISAYRVCQTTPSQAGATSAFMQQYTHLRKEGQSKPNPRRQILQDLLQLI